MIFDNLKEIINPDPDIIINIQPHKKEARILLEESDPLATLKRVELRGFIDSDTFAFKLDATGKRISNYLNPSAQRINKACDAIIFTKIDKKCYIFCCELKSKRVNEKECIIKYKNSRLFVSYIINILKEFYDCKTEFEYKFILFDNKAKPRKTPTKRQKIEREKLNDSDFYAYRIHRLDTFLNIRHLHL